MGNRFPSVRVRCALIHSASSDAVDRNNIKAKAKAKVETMYVTMYTNPETFWTLRNVQKKSNSLFLWRYQDAESATLLLGQETEKCIALCVPVRSGAASPLLTRLWNTASYSYERVEPSEVSFLGRRYGFRTPIQEVFDLLVHDLLAEMPEAASRPKQTDEVNGSTQTGTETHGGDSASGEVPDGESDAGESADARKMKNALRRRQRLGVRAGTTAHATLLRNVDPLVRRRIAQAFSLLVSDGDEAPSVRYDWGKVLMRMFTHQHFSRAREEGRGRPIILVLADVSGSCSSFAQPAAAVAMAAGAVGVGGADILVVSFDNAAIDGSGIRPRQTSLNGGEPVAAKGRTLADALGARHNDVRVIVALGDNQALDGYVALGNLPQIERLIWLDNYLSSCATPEIRRNLHVLPPTITHVVGCGTAEDMVEGLFRAMRRG